MKKIILLLTAVSVILTFTGCSDKKNKSDTVNENITDTSEVSGQKSGRTVITIGTVGEMTAFPTEYEFNASQND